MELPLQGCSITYIPRDSKKKKHELKITQQGTDPLLKLQQRAAEPVLSSGQEEPRVNPFCFQVVSISAKEKQS